MRKGVALGKIEKEIEKLTPSGKIEISREADSPIEEG